MGMDQFGITEFRPGDEITSEKLNAIIQAAVREQVGGLSLSDPQGTIFRNPLPGGGGSGVQIIRFQLLQTVNCSSCSMLARVLSRPPGVSVVPGEGPSDGYEDTVTVYDYVGCWLNAPEDELVGKVGYASRLTANVPLSCQPPVDYDPYEYRLRTRWEIMFLCYSSAICGEAFDAR